MKKAQEVSLRHQQNLKSSVQLSSLSRIRALSRVTTWKKSQGLHVYMRACIHQRLSSWVGDAEILEIIVQILVDFSSSCSFSKSSIFVTVMGQSEARHPGSTLLVNM